MCGCLSSGPYWESGPATQACALTGNQTSDLSVWALNPQSHPSHGSLYLLLMFFLPFSFLLLLLLSCHKEDFVFELDILLW